jgi:RHS repeat-associated protein
MAYHWDKGGIFTKSDVGSFLYNNSTKPYAPSEISPTSMIIPNAVDSLTYTSFECVKTIQEDPYSASFVYNADNGRSKMEVKQNTTTILTRWYSESSYIKETAGGTTKEYTFIGGDPYTAPVVAITQSGTTTYYYLLRDHLGSITHVVDATSGTLAYQYSYDAWGWMRNVSTWTNYGSGSEPSPFVAGRSFTGHEYLPWFNLINMNCRMYDPLVGQFLSPDNVIQDPYNSQNLNRYLYCLNNPLKSVDPTGSNIYKIQPENWAKFLAQADAGLSLDGLGGMYGDLIWDDNLYSQYSLGYNSGGGNYSNQGSISGPQIENNDWKRLESILFSVKDQLKAMNELYYASYDNLGNITVENNAFITNKGILLLPNYLNTASNSKWSYLPIDNHFVSFNNQKLVIFGTIHTHPGGPDYDWVNGYDINNLSNFGAVFVLSDIRLWGPVIDKNGREYVGHLMYREEFLKNGNIYNFIKIRPDINY